LLNNHPSKDIIGTRGNELKGKHIVLCITGSVAAVECPEIARALMRRGAEVFAVMSPMSQTIIHPFLMEWATGNEVIAELTGKIEHVALAGKHSNEANLILVAPATANTISKIACGIDDTTVTSVVSTAFGSNIPIIIVPAMHESMYNHPLLTENINKLKALGVEFVGPRIEEGKAKISKVDEISDAVIRRFAVSQDFSCTRILITAGPTVEYIDPIRVITNRSSGRMGVALAEEALSRGAEVTLVYGPGIATPPTRANLILVQTTSQMYEAVVSELESKKYDVIIAAAAVADWAVEKPFSHKISTHKHDTLSLRLRPTRKIIDSIKKISPKTFLVAFRAEYKLSNKDLIESGHRRLLEAKADLIVVNDVGKEGAGFWTETNEVIIVDAKKRTSHVPLAHKREVAREILDAVKDRIKPK
jgi:phosphopantothenoylcysteine decarboxylase/phosphopantothenate--cysteine ligase